MIEQLYSDAIAALKTLEEAKTQLSSLIDDIEAFLERPVAANTKKDKSYIIPILPFGISVRLTSSEDALGEKGDTAIIKTIVGHTTGSGPTSIKIYSKNAEVRYSLLLTSGKDNGFLTARFIDQFELI